MTFERTVLLSAILHAVILAALAVSIRRPYIVLHPFEVNLVAPPAKNLSVSKSAVSVQAAPKPAAHPKEKAVPPPRPERQKQSMVANPQAERSAMRREQSLVKGALRRLREHEREQSLVKNALERLKGIAGVEKTVIEIGKNAPASSGAAGGNTALNGYLQTVRAMIMRQWFLPDLKIHGETAVISITILKDGTIVAQGFDKHSGDALLDESAMRAIQRTGKVPPPPYQLEIAVGFTPN